MYIQNLFHFSRHMVRTLALASLLLGVFLLDSAVTDSSAAAVPTRTPTRRPTLTPTPRTGTFSVSSGNKNQPNDVLGQLYVGGIGGGEGPRDCDNAAPAPYLSNAASSSQELFTNNYLYICGLDVNEPVEIRVQYPGGKVIQSQVWAKKDGGMIFSSFNLRPAWTDPAGTYQVTFSAPSGQVAATVRVTSPNGPRVVRFENKSVLLYRFSPNENVRLFVYGKCGTAVCLKAWQVFQVDGQGSLLINLGSDLGGMSLFVVGERTGEFGDIYGFTSDPGSYKLTKTSPDKSSFMVPTCPGAPPQRIKVGWYGMVCTKGDRVKLRQGPSRSAATIMMLDPGTQFSVIGGPSCSDNWSWYQIKLDSSQTGWIAEGGDNIDPYFICPLQ